MRSSRSYYDLLGVSETASATEIDDAYQRLLKATDPDQGGSSALRDLVREAYDVVSDPLRRSDYDAGLGIATRTVAEPAAEPDELAEPDKLAVAAEPASDMAPPDRPAQELRPPPAWWRPAVAVLSLLLAIGLVAVGVVAFQVREADAAKQARGEALAAATAHAQAILSYDHRTLDADFARALAVSTGGFRSDYEKTTSTVVRPNATQYKAVVKAEVTSAAVVRATSERAVVLLFVDQTTTSTRLDAPKRDRNRVRMTLTKAGGRWLVSDVDAL